MKRHLRILLTTLVALTVTLGFALAIGSTHSPLVNAPSEHILHSEHEHTKHVSEHALTLNAHNYPNGSRALADIHAHVQRHLGHFNARLETFGGTHEWSPEWDLHWLDVEHSGNVVRIYHATSNEHPHNRFIWMAHSGSPHQAAWEEVR